MNPSKQNILAAEKRAMGRAQEASHTTALPAPASCHGTSCPPDGLWVAECLDLYKSNSERGLMEQKQSLNNNRPCAVIGVHLCR